MTNTPKLSSVSFYRTNSSNTQQRHPQHPNHNHHTNTTREIRIQTMVSLVILLSRINRSCSMHNCGTTVAFGVPRRLISSANTRSRNRWIHLSAKNNQNDPNNDDINSNQKAGEGGTKPEGSSRLMDLYNDLFITEDPMASSDTGTIPERNQPPPPSSSSVDNEGYLTDVDTFFGRNTSSTNSNVDGGPVPPTPPSQPRRRIVPSVLEYDPSPTPTTTPSPSSRISSLSSSIRSQPHPKRTRTIPPTFEYHDSNIHDDSYYVPSGYFEEPDLSTSPTLDERSDAPLSPPPPESIVLDRSSWNGRERYNRSRESMGSSFPRLTPPVAPVSPVAQQRPTSKPQPQQYRRTTNESSSVASFLEKNPPLETDQLGTVGETTRTTTHSIPSSSSFSMTPLPSTPVPNSSLPPPPPPIGTATLPSTTTNKKISPRDYYNHDTTTLRSYLLHLQTTLTFLNHNTELNVNSPRKVSMVLFGVPDETVDRSALESIVEGGSGSSNSSSDVGNRATIAKHVLECRSLTRYIKKRERDERNKESGRYATNIVGTVSVSQPSPSPSLLSPSATAVDTEPTNDNDEPLPSPSPLPPIVLIDASAIIFRSYYSMPPLHRADGEPVGALLGVCNTLNRLMLEPLLRHRYSTTTGGSRTDTEEEPSSSLSDLRIVLVFDSETSNNGRKALYPEYKSNRKPCPEDLLPQFDFVKRAAVEAYGITVVEAEGYEADDVIATLATRCWKEGRCVNILSGDKDLLQLVTPDSDGDGGKRPHVHVIDPTTMERRTHQFVVDTWGVPPSKLGDVLALAGDSADNVPGVPGIGKVTAKELIQQYGSLEEVLERADEIPQKKRRENLLEFRETARVSRLLVELERGIGYGDMAWSWPAGSLQTYPNSTMAWEEWELSQDVSTCDLAAVERLDEKRLLRFYDDMGLRDLRRRTEERIAAVASANRVSDTAKAVETITADRSKSGGEGEEAVDGYASILYGGSGGAYGGIGRETREVGQEERRDVIVESPRGAAAAEAAVTEFETESESVFVSKGMPSFYSPRQYVAPPDPSEFKDVPF